MNVNTSADHCHGTRGAHTALCLQKLIPLCFQPHLLSSLLRSLGLTTQVQQLQFSVPTATHNKSGRFKQPGLCPSHFLLNWRHLLPRTSTKRALVWLGSSSCFSHCCPESWVWHSHPGALWQPHAMQHFLQFPWSAYRKNKKFCIFLFSTLFLWSP